MRKEDLKIARDKYEYLLAKNDELRKLKRKWQDFFNNKNILEYIILKEYNNKCFQDRIIELESSSEIKKYLYLMEESDKFRPKFDDELIDESFTHVVGDINKLSNIFVYIASYDKVKLEGVPAKVSDYDLPNIEILNYRNLGELDPRIINRVYKKVGEDTAHYYICRTLDSIPKVEYELEESSDPNCEYKIYRDLETKLYILVHKKNIQEFERENKVITFKRTNNDYLTLFYNLRSKYLREHLLNDNCNLFKKNTNQTKKRNLKYKNN